MSSVRTAKIEVSSAAAYALPARSRNPAPTSTDLALGRKRRRLGRSGRARARTLVRGATRRTSPGRSDSLQRRELERAEEAHLVLELHPEAVAHPAPRLGHQRERICRRRSTRVLDEVRVA